MVSGGMQDSRSGDSAFRRPEANDALVKLATQELAQWRRLTQTSRGVLVTTDCLYLDGTSVVVAVDGGPRAETVVVHDDAGADDRLAAGGRVTDKASSVLRRIAKRYGLQSDGNSITSAPSPPSHISMLVPLVANASKEAAEALWSASVPRLKRDLVGEVAQVLSATFPEQHVFKRRSVQGASTRAYEFDMYVELRGDRVVLVDAITPSSRSINSAFVSNVDVGRRGDKKFLSYVVYTNDDKARIGAGSLSLLASVATPVEFKSLEGTLRSLAA